MPPRSGALDADLVLLASGVRPGSDLARDAGLALGEGGEVLYYLEPVAFAATLRWLDDAVAAAGRVVAVHWTGSAPDLQRSADDVHDALARRPGLTRLATTRADTYRLDVLAAGA